MSRYRFECLYRGDRFYGWQLQPDHPTVQEELQRVCSDVLDRQITIHGAGRTDRGVHALGQVAHFSLNTSVSLPFVQWQAMFNERLPNSIQVLNLREIDTSFHSRHSARRRHYGYRFFREGYAARPFMETGWILAADNWNPDRTEWIIDLFNKGIPTDVFSGKGGSSYSADTWSVETRTRRRCSREFWLLVSAESFKYRMVRCLAGALKRYVTKEWTRRDVENRFRSSETVNPAPANGCFLLGIEYESNTLPACGWKRILQYCP